MAPNSSVMKTVYLTLLITVVGAVLLFFLGRLNIDPRIYRFLDSGTGKTVAKIMGWSVDFDLAAPDKPEAEMTQQEIEVKRTLQEAVGSRLPTHRLVLNSGEAFEGKVLAITSKYVKFQETYGDSGAMAASIRRSRIREVRDLYKRPPEITYRDVKLRVNFPDFEFHREPPYTVVTDENYFRVQKSVKVLRRVHDGFMDLFEPLITHPERGDGIQLVFFAGEKEYKKYAEKYAPRLENSSGFYSPMLDQLIVFNQITTGQIKAANRELKRQERLYRRSARKEDMTQFEMWRDDMVRSVRHFAEQQTVFTIRHEGAHQLFFTYGVHSKDHVENTWLIEGLAVFFEPDRPGDRIPDRLALLHEHYRGNTMIPLDELVESRAAQGLFVFGKEERVNLAYAESWILVHFLMQPRHRNDFFNYIRFIRDPDNLDEIALHSRIELLARALNLTEGQLHRRWLTYVDRM
jgi:hypothetical protein